MKTNNSLLQFSFQTVVEKCNCDSITHSCWEITIPRNPMLIQAGETSIETIGSLVDLTLLLYLKKVLKTNEL